MAGTSTHRVCVNDTISERAGTFQNPGELWEVMKQSLRQLSVDADAEVVAELAILFRWRSHQCLVKNLACFIRCERIQPEGDLIGGCR
jgi:hypothetical protein